MKPPFLAVFYMMLLFTQAVSAQQLHRYTCLSDHLEVEAYESDNPLYIKDAQGVIRGDRNYHPVRIGLYGIINYDKFIETGDSVYYFRTINQAHYFRNPENYHLKFDGKGIALPYTYDYKDLVAPWYSGMAQGLAVSYLLRYCQLTGDTALYPTIRKLVYFQIQPESEGGTISSSEENGLWIEEYANSPITRQVLNGSINAWLGLYEYCTFFPEDQAAQNVRQAAYTTLVRSLEKFNVPEWCRYDLNGKLCSPSYLRYHIYQMKHLLELTGEQKFYRQLMLWATLLYNHKLESGTDELSKRSHKIAVKAPPGTNGVHLPLWGMLPELNRQGNTAKSHNFTHHRALEHYLERKVTPPPTEEKAVQKWVLMEFSDVTRVDYLTFHYTSDQQSAPEFSLFTVDPKSKKLIPLQIESDQLGDNDWHCRIMGKIPEKGFEHLILSAKGKKAGTIRDTKIGLFNTQSIHMPWFGYYNSGHITMSAAKTYSIYVPRTRTGDVKLFYRVADTEKQVWETPFQPNQLVKGNTFTPPETGVYQFSIVFEIESILSTVGMMIYQDNQ